MGEETKGKGRRGTQKVKRKASQEASTKGEAAGSWPRSQGTKENRQRYGQCPRCSTRNDQNQRAIGRGKENFPVYPYQTLGFGRYGRRPTQQQSHRALGYHCPPRD